MKKAPQQADTPGSRALQARRKRTFKKVTRLFVSSKMRAQTDAGA